MKAIIVGRHTSEIPGVEIVRQESVTFELNAAAAFRQLDELIAQAHAEDAALILQNVPGVLAAGMFKFAALLHTDERRVPVGIIISVPGPRAADVSREFNMDNPMDLNTLESAIKFVNARAKISDAGTYTVCVTVDPVPQFIFSHIEWLTQS